MQIITAAWRIITGTQFKLEFKLIAALPLHVYPTALPEGLSYYFGGRAGVRT